MLLLLGVFLTAGADFHSKSLRAGADFQSKSLRAGAFVDSSFHRFELLDKRFQKKLLVIVMWP